MVSFIPAIVKQNSTWLKKPDFFVLLISQIWSKIWTKTFTSYCSMNLAGHDLSIQPLCTTNTYVSILEKFSCFQIYESLVKCLYKSERVRITLKVIFEGNWIRYAWNNESRDTKRQIEQNFMKYQLYSNSSNQI